MKWFICFFLSAACVFCFSQNMYPYHWDDDFQILSGKDIDWQKMEISPNWLFFNKYQNLFLKNKSLLFSSHQNTKIPKSMHFIWLGPKNFPISSLPFIRSWISLHPMWKIIFWTDRERPAPCSGMEKRIIDKFYLKDLKNCYEETTNWGEKSDLLRYEILKKEGGVYIDHDASCLWPLDVLHQSFDFYAALADPHPQSLTVPNGCFGCVSNHPVLEKTIEIILASHEKMKMLYPECVDEKRKVLSHTYIALTRAVEEKIDLPGYQDIIFPTNYFWSQDIKKSVFLFHHYAGSWMKDKKTNLWENKIKKKFFKLKKMNRTLVVLEALLVLFMIIFFLLSLKEVRKTS